MVQWRTKPSNLCEEADIQSNSSTVFFANFLELSTCLFLQSEANVRTDRLGTWQPVPSIVLSRLELWMKHGLLFRTIQLTIDVCERFQSLAMPNWLGN